MEVREANKGDWKELHEFYNAIYREKHPLQNREFWEWQYGDPAFGRAFISIGENGKITGHVGANFGGGLAWIINVYLTEECRGQGILARLYALARNYFPLAATAANAAGLGLYRNMRWIRYDNLNRYVKLNPSISASSVSSVCAPVALLDVIPLSEGHYFKQPGINGILLADSTAVNQSHVGGARIVDLGNVSGLEAQAWEAGFLWIDYITSWNDLKIKELEASGWVRDFNSVVPWRLNPIEENYFCDITFLSEKPIYNEFIVHRSYSDHGRIGSL